MPKLRYRKERGYYFVVIDGKRHLLGHDKEKAQYKYHAMMANPGDGASPVVALLLDDYLGYVQENKAESTYRRRKPVLSSFVRHIGIHLTVDQLKRHHIRDWIKSAYGHCGTTTQNDCITIVVTALNWACEQDYIPSNPIAGIKKPERQKYQWTPLDQGQCQLPVPAPQEEVEHARAVRIHVTSQLRLLESIAWS